MNILVIRSAPFEVVASAIKALRKRWPNAAITLLVQESVQKEYEVAQLADIYQPLFPGFFSLWKAQTYFRGRLKAGCYQRIIIVYNNIQGRGYRRMEWFFSNLAFRTVEGYYYDLPIRVCGIYRLLGLDRFFFIITAGLVFPVMVLYIFARTVSNRRRKSVNKNEL